MSFFSYGVVTKGLRWGLFLCSSQSNKRQKPDFERFPSGMAVGLFVGGVDMEESRLMG